MKQRGLFFISALSVGLTVAAQDNKTWSLEDCINYALEKNIQLQQNKLSLQSTEVDVKSAKAELFPSLSFSTGHNLVNRPNQESSATVSGTEIITSNSSTTYNGSYSLNAQWTVWNGGQRLNNIKQQKKNMEIANLTVAETENMLQEEITKLFVQILYANESVEINKNTLEVSEATYKRAVELFNEGSLSKSDVAQLEAQASNDKYQLVTAESTLRNYKLQLKQLLELDGTTEMVLDMPELKDEDVMDVLPNQIDVYNTALTSRPEIQSSKLSIDNAKLGIKTAKAGYLPTISLSASTSSMTNNASTNNWAEQMKYGWNNMIGINLSIPIFNNRQTKSAVQKAQITYSSSQLDLINKQKELYSTIESLWLDALNAQQQYEAANSKLQSCQTSFDIVNEQFNLGIKNTCLLYTSPRPRDCS